MVDSTIQTAHGRAPLPAGINSIEDILPHDSGRQGGNESLGCSQRESKRGETGWGARVNDNTQLSEERGGKVGVSHIAVISSIIALGLRGRPSLNQSSNNSMRWLS